MTIIYGVDTRKKVTPVMVRDAIIRCFILAHEHILNEMKEYDDFESEEEFERMKELDVELLVKKMFHEVGGDFDKPTKESLVKVCDRLVEFASNFRKPSNIRRHYNEIMKIIDKLE